MERIKLGQKRQTCAIGAYIYVGNVVVVRIRSGRGYYVVAIDILHNSRAILWHWSRTKGKLCRWGS